MKNYARAILMGIGLLTTASAAEWVDFGALPLKPADERAYTHSPATLADGQIASSLAWEKPTRMVALHPVRASSEWPVFETAEFTLTLDLPAPVALRRIVLRLRDRNGELHQFAPRPSDSPGQLPEGRVTLTYAVDVDAPADSVWDGDDNKRLDFPIRLAGFAVDFSDDTQAGALRFVTLACMVPPEQLAIQLDSGGDNPLILAPDAAPTLRLHNVGSLDLSLSGAVDVAIDADAPVTTSLATIALEAGADTRIALPGDYAATPGYWHVLLRLRSEAKIYEKHYTFARPAPNAPRPLFISHRGESHDAPENTMAAFRLAWERNVDGVELDVRLSADGKVLVFHDANTRRLSGVSHDVEKTDAATLRALDVGRHRGEKFAGEKIPLLSDVLAALPTTGLLFIEMKTEKNDEALATATWRTVEASGVALDRLRFISFSGPAIAQVKTLQPHAKTYLVANGWYNAAKRDFLQTPEALVAAAREARADGIDLLFGSFWRYPLVKTIRDAGLELHAWVVDIPAQADYAAALGVDSITTNRARFLTDSIYRP